MRHHGFGELASCDAVRTVGPNPSPDADSEDLVVALTRSSAVPGGSASAEILMPVSQGASVLVALKHALREEFIACGNRHWGTHTDCNAISEHLDVGMLLFADSLQQRGAQCLVNLNALRGVYACLIALWWDGPSHFRLAQYREGTSLPWRSFWRAADLPPSLRPHYDLCNPTAPVGSARRLALH